jgi:hypothetical protein
MHEARSTSLEKMGNAYIISNRNNGKFRRDVQEAVDA